MADFETFALIAEIMILLCLIIDYRNKKKNYSDNKFYFEEPSVQEQRDLNILHQFKRCLGMFRSSLRSCSRGKHFYIGKTLLNADECMQNKGGLKGGLQDSTKNMVHPVPNSPTGTISEPNLKRFALKALMLCIVIFAACILPGLYGVFYRQNHKIASGTRDEPLWIKSLQPVCLRSNNVTMHTTIQISGSSGYLDDFTINAIHKAIKANEKIKFDVKCKAWVPITFSASEPYVANCQDMELYVGWSYIAAGAEMFNAAQQCSAN